MVNTNDRRSQMRKYINMPWFANVPLIHPSKVFVMRQIAVMPPILGASAACNPKRLGDYPGVIHCMRGSMSIHWKYWAFLRNIANANNGSLGSRRVSIGPKHDWTIFFTIFVFLQCCRCSTTITLAMTGTKRSVFFIFSEIITTESLNQTSMNSFSSLLQHDTCPTLFSKM